MFDNLAVSEWTELLWSLHSCQEVSAVTKVYLGHGV